MAKGFKPWVGPGYEDGIGGLRILVLGESHYIQPEWDAGDRMTIQAVEENGLRKRHPFFTKVAKLVLDRRDHITDDERRQFWNSVAFYNYVQESVGLSPRDRPTDVMWASAGPAFLSQLAELRPHCMIVLGQGLWGWLPKPAHEQADPFALKVFELADHKVFATYTKHPSGRGFNYDTFGPQVQQLLKAAGEACSLAQVR
ncbi:hypothetical protein D3C72_820530 [compost metagenome]